MGADSCVRFYFRCALLLFSNKGAETKPEHSSVARIFYSQELKTRQVLIHFSFISILPGDICAYGLGSCNTWLVLSNNFLLIIPLTV